MDIKIPPNRTPFTFDRRYPLPAMRALHKLGQDIRDARRRRRIRVTLAAERASISKTTWLKVEKGDPSVRMGIYAQVLFVLGLADKLAALADPAKDAVACNWEKSNCRNGFEERGLRSMVEIRASANPREKKTSQICRAYALVQTQENKGLIHQGLRFIFPLDRRST